jgi:prephenate dehydrogenase
VSVVRVRRLAVVGVGLIGGSCALALKRAGAVDRVVGIGRGRANLEQAFALGVVDEIADDVATGVADADAVLVTTPVGQMPRVFDVLREALPPDAVVTDGGSTKRDVVAAARASLGARLHAIRARASDRRRRTVRCERRACSAVRRPARRRDAAGRVGCRRGRSRS